MRSWSGAGVSGAVVLAMVACSSNDNSAGGDSDSGMPHGDAGLVDVADGDASPTMPPCNVSAGGILGPTCGAASDRCEASGGCSIDPSCGSASTCLPMADNSGKSALELRIRRLRFGAPRTFATRGFEGTLVNGNIELDAPKCGENGSGSFSWLLRVDRAAGTITTGGAPPSADPFGKGFCFYRHRIADFDVTPGVAHVNFTGDTFTTTEKIPKLFVPMFLHGDIKNAVVLPLSDVVIHEATISAGGNCVGSFHAEALDRECKESPSDCATWRPNAAMAGYINLEEADKVMVVDLLRSLCVVATGASPGPNGKCPRDANGKLALSAAQQGDYCSTSKQPGDCRDSFWVTASFAASAAKIHDGAGVPECAP